MHVHKLKDGTITSPAGGGSHSHAVGSEITGPSPGNDTDEHIHSYSGGRTGPPLLEQFLSTSQKNDLSNDQALRQNARQATLQRGSGVNHEGLLGNISSNKVYVDSDGKHVKPDETFSIKGVEVFAEGTWNGDKYTNEDLKEMVRAFNSNKEKLKPFLKLGHDDKQKIVQNDGLPAAGWVDNLRQEGSKLIADFIDLPKKIFQLIKNGAYKKVSSEIYWNIEIEGQPFKRMLSAVALLGTDMPAVSSLDDILALYGIKNFDTIKQYAADQSGITIKNHTFSKENEDMEKVEQLAADKAKLEVKVKDLEAQHKKFAEAKEAELKKHAADLAKIEEDKIVEQRKHQVESLVKDELAVPSMEKGLYKLLDKKHSYAKDETSFSVLKDLLKLAKESYSVNVSEHSEKGKEGSESEDVLSGKLEKYASDNKISYRDAYEQHQSGQLEL
jgi:hypothetical protein